MYTCYRIYRVQYFQLTPGSAWKFVLRLQNAPRDVSECPLVINVGARLDINKEYFKSLYFIKRAP